MNIRKKTGAAVLGVLCMAALAGCQNQQSQTAQTAEYIGIEAAKETALKSAGLTEDQADFSTAGLDSRDGTFFYQVNFEAEGMEYDYAIDAVTGVVIEENPPAQPQMMGRKPPALRPAGTRQGMRLPARCRLPARHRLPRQPRHPQRRRTPRTPA